MISREVDEASLKVLFSFIEAWRRSFEKIREACALYDGPLPEKV